MIRFSVDSAAARKEADRIIGRILADQTDVVREETRGLEQDLEKITRLSVPGRLWRAWGSQAFPKQGAARNPAGTVFVSGGGRSQGAIKFFTQSGRIQSKTGGYLAIPTPAAGSRGRARDLTPGEWERRNGGRLRFVYRRGKSSLLVLDEGVLSGKGQVGRLNSARRRASGRGNATIVIFVLIPFANFDKRFSIEPVIDRRRQRFNTRVAQVLESSAKGAF